jgi:hypothetical protein
MSYLHIKRQRAIRFLSTCIRGFDFAASSWVFDFILELFRQWYMVCFSMCLHSYKLSTMTLLGTTLCVRNRQMFGLNRLNQQAS